MAELYSYLNKLEWVICSVWAAPTSYGCIFSQGKWSWTSISTVCCASNITTNISNGGANKEIKQQTSLGPSPWYEWELQRNVWLANPASYLLAILQVWRAILKSRAFYQRLKAAYIDESHLYQNGKYIFILNPGARPSFKDRKKVRT